LTEPDSLERRVVRKVSWRLLPYLFLLYVIAYIDRINVSVAKLQMTQDLKLTADIFGAGAGIFFVGYFLFEVPSNFVLSRVGARVWIARIMIVWGLVSVAMMFVSGVKSFYVLRFLLGAAEAGFFPGVLFYLTHWFREKDRARAISLFMTAGTLAGAVGNPLSGALMQLDGKWGMEGWQWLFLLEGVPAILFGISVLFLLTEKPELARWLTAEESTWLRAQIADERAGKAGAPAVTLRQGLAHPRVWHLAAVYFLLVVGAYGFEFWIPTIVKSLFGGSEVRITLISTVPYVVATVVMVLVAHHSDRTGERRWHVALSMFVACVCFAVAVVLKKPILVLASLSVAWSGLKSCQGPFWAIPPAFLSGTAAAGGIALINSVANLGGFLGPWFVGLLERHTGGYSAGLLMSSGLLLASGLLALTLRPPPKLASA
jgi:ACS family tartrate transporter-like MFS transporter